MENENQRGGVGAARSGVLGPSSRGSVLPAATRLSAATARLPSAAGLSTFAGPPAAMGWRGSVRSAPGVEYRPPRRGLHPLRYGGATAPPVCVCLQERSTLPFVQLHEAGCARPQCELLAQACGSSARSEWVLHFRGDQVGRPPESSLCERALWLCRTTL